MAGVMIMLTKAIPQTAPLLLPTLRRTHAAHAACCAAKLKLQ
jgi:hypothetical protein